MTMIKTTAAALALISAIAAPAVAAEAATKQSAAVTYADLNLASDAGRAVLDRRIEHAVEKVCGRTTGNAGMDASVRKCQRDTLASARKSRDLAVADYASKRLAKADSKVIRLVAQ